MQFNFKMIHYLILIQIIALDFLTFQLPDSAFFVSDSKIHICLIKKNTNIHKRLIEIM
jgi:hypothetical protein